MGWSVGAAALTSTWIDGLRARWGCIYDSIEPFAKSCRGAILLDMSLNRNQPGVDRPILVVDCIPKANMGALLLGLVVQVQGSVTN